MSIIALNLSEVLKEILERPWLRESAVSLGMRELRLPMLDEEVMLLFPPAVVEEVVGMIKLETLKGDLGIAELSRFKICAVKNSSIMPFDCELCLPERLKESGPLLPLILFRF